VTRARLAPWLAAALVVLAACTSDASAPATSPTPAPSEAPETRTAPGNPSAIASPGLDEPLPAVSPGRPYDAQAVLAAMRASARPGGVPDQLETDAVAAAVAEQLWTWDGRPYPLLQAGGACGPQACSLELAGAPRGAAGADLYVFSVLPASSTVRLEAADLHGYPARLDRQLDALVRRRLPAADLAGLALAAASWQPPPDETVMVAAYRSGGEEGAPAVDVVVDLASEEVLELREP
jgi:hypothetical protein